MPLPLQSGAGERLFPSPKLTFQDRLSWDSKLITNRRDCDLYQQRWINWAGISSSHLPPNFLSRCLLSRPLIPASAVCTSVSRKASMVKCTELTLYRLGEKEMLKLRCLWGFKRTLIPKMGSTALSGESLEHLHRGMGPLLQANSRSPVGNLSHTSPGHETSLLTSVLPPHPSLLCSLLPA